MLSAWVNYISLFQHGSRWLHVHVLFPKCSSHWYLLCGQMFQLRLLCVPYTFMFSFLSPWLEKQKGDFAISQMSGVSVDVSVVSITKPCERDISSSVRRMIMLLGGCERDHIPKSCLNFKHQMCILSS